jgi:hypothetical protein
MLTLWFLVGLLLGSSTGALATDLERNELSGWRRLWGFPFWHKAIWNRRIRTRYWRLRQQTLHPKERVLRTAILLWFTLAIILVVHHLRVGYWSDPWPAMTDFVTGSLVGGAAAPWVWLHFSRRFGNGKSSQGDRIKRIQQRAREIWEEEGRPDGRWNAHRERAVVDIDAEDEAASEKRELYAGQEFERYRFVSIGLGIALVIASLWPTLQRWIPRTQQIQVFGISLILASQRPDSARNSLLTTGQRSDSALNNGLRNGTFMAYRIAASDPSPPKPGKPARRTILGEVGPGIHGLEDLSMIDRDQAYIAWLTARSYGIHSNARTVLSYVNDIRDNEDVRHYETSQGRYMVDTDVRFLKQLSPVLKCLYDHATWVGDTRIFAADINKFLKLLLAVVSNDHDGWRSGKFLTEMDQWIESPSTMPIGCNIDSVVNSIIRYYEAPLAQFINSAPQVTPYPVLSAAYYLASVNDTEGSVRIIQDWIRKNNVSDLPESQRSWYDLRAMLAASQLSYQYTGFNPPHAQLILWQESMTDFLSRLLNVKDKQSWKAFCKSLSGETIEKQIGRSLAFVYSQERFYLFENLIPSDFDDTDPIARRSAQSYIDEAEAIRDTPNCYSGTEDYDGNSPQYAAYFNLYTAQLRLSLLSRADDAENRRLIGRIRSELLVASQFGPGSRASELLAPVDQWERHRARLKLLREEVDRISGQLQ